MDLAMNQIIIRTGYMNPYDNVSELEKVIAEYGGSKYAVAVDSCTNALLLTLKYRFKIQGYTPLAIEIPAYTYVGVAYSVVNAGGQLGFRDEVWHGCYEIGMTKIIDSARRFKRGMYIKDTLYCVSCHWSKHLKIGRGGFILTDDKEAARILRIMRFDGRTAGMAPKDDQFIYPGHHCYMLPEEAARGLMLMSNMADDNDDLPWDDYSDLRENFKYGMDKR